MEHPLKCIICRMQPESVMNAKDVQNQPYAATTFKSRGHYGSTVFDPMGDIYSLEINICDKCLVEASKDDFVISLVTRIPKAPEYEYEKWNP